jgi:hypothetical protein
MVITGVECAGLALAVLPLVIETGKVWASGGEALADIALLVRRDKKLSYFYDHFWWESVELNQKLRQIVDALPNLPLDRKLRLATAANLEDWTTQADVTAALQSYFATSDDVNSFLHVMTKLVSLLAQLVKDSTIHITAADAVSSSHNSAQHLCDPLTRF